MEKNQKTNTEIDELNQSESTKYAEDIKTLSREEVKRYFIAMSNRESNGDNSMTAGEYFVFEDDIQNRKAQYWLNGADKLLEKIEEQ